MVTNKIVGCVKSINQSGNLVSDITEAQLKNAPRDSSINIEFDGHQTVGIFDNDHSEAASTMVAKMNSDGLLEIEIVGMSLSKMLGIKSGIEVTVSW